MDAGRANGEEPVDTGFEILARVLPGIPADLSWRYATMRASEVGRTGGKKMLSRFVAALGTLIAVFFGVFFGYIGIGRGGDSAEFAMLPMIAGLALIVGVTAANWSVRIGTTLVAAGTAAIILMMSWLIAITLPLGAVAVWGTLARGQGSTERPSTT